MNVVLVASLLLVERIHIFKESLTSNGIVTLVVQ